MSSALENADPFRPLWHFTAARHWINDPNGLIYEGGEYHLFFQHNPFGEQWGHMSWGHALSRDLLHWQELPLAIPEDERVSIYSGSIVIDHANSSGFGSGAQAPWVAIYTGCLRVPQGGQAQELAYSLDRGLSWTKYAGNPVLDLGLRDFRDPKVFWHAPTRRWVMAVVRPDDHQVSFFASVNLRHWLHLSDFGPAGEVGGIWECPDLIEFPAVEAGQPSRWLLKVDTFAGHPGGSGAQVFIGQFDGRQFICEPGAGQAGQAGQAGFWVDHGCDFYAALSWAGLPPEAGRPPLWIAWMNNHGYAKHTPSPPARPWRGAMSVPRELFLQETAEGTRLAQRPWPGLAALRGPQHEFEIPGQGLHDLKLPDEVDARSLELQWDLRLDPASCFSLRLRCSRDGLRYTEVGIDGPRGQVYVDRSRSGLLVDEVRWAGRREAPLPQAAGALRLRLLLDACSVEVFVSELGRGEADDAATACLSELIFPEAADLGLQAWVFSQESAGPPQACLTPLGGGPGAARPWGHSQGAAAPSLVRVWPLQPRAADR